MSNIKSQKEHVHINILSIQHMYINRISAHANIKISPLVASIKGRIHKIIKQTKHTRIIGPNIIRNITNVPKDKEKIGQVC